MRAGSPWTDACKQRPAPRRIDAPPLHLPPIAVATRVVIVRHGQSTWNAVSRIQGSSDLSELTEKGKSQAEAAQIMVGQLSDTRSTCYLQSSP
jgi:hypothetical protein